MALPLLFRPDELPGVDAGDITCASGVLMELLAPAASELSRDGLGGGSGGGVSSTVSVTGHLGMKVKSGSVWWARTTNKRRFV